MSKNICYFAYGSNMDAERMKKRVGRLPDRIPGALRNWRLEFNKASKNIPAVGFANIVPCLGKIVEGVLYLLSEEELQELDRYEGVSHHYKRHQVSVERRDTGEVVAAVTYVANPNKVRDGLKPTREYIGYLLSGADYLSEEYVRRLRAVETLD
ncbi:cation transport regulator ChaC [Thermodesulfitimonas autotrophica]|uniref:Cation transport regulator ChaC n=1 Tax=Thermodesulfitimonas autotrophica TaxID=1894989 RepID=A0A3N5B1H7_9THEO|nr:gamma-glutamylcyclotransferase family protein [Thermodesulfitimonas autotrophica]RPF49470.1 cation transport regulator ChaC [Thermodesulfitimonas autotrophica]